LSVHAAKLFLMLHIMGKISHPRYGCSFKSAEHHPLYQKDEVNLHVCKITVGTNPDHLLSGAVLPFSMCCLEPMKWEASASHEKLA